MAVLKFGSLNVIQLRRILAQDQDRGGESIAIPGQLPRKQISDGC